MAEVEISYKGNNIATMNASGTKTLLTEGKYLEDDVTVEYTRPSAPSGTYIIEAPGTYDISNYQYVKVDIDMWTEQTISTAGAVTQELQPYVIYHFTGALTSLTVTLAAAAQGQIAHYHFDFDSPSTAVTLNLPATVETPDGFSVEASKHYEIDILNNYGTAQGW